MKAAGGLKLGDAVWDDRQNSGLMTELFSLGGAKAGGKAMDSVLVGIEEFGLGKVIIHVTWTLVWKYRGQWFSRAN